MSPEVVSGLFILGGALIGFALKAWHDSRTKDRKTITIVCGRPIRLLEVDSEVSSTLKISVSDRTITSLYAFDVTVINTGNMTVNNLEVPVSVTTEGFIITVGTRVSTSGVVGEGYSEQLTSDKSYRFTIGYLNPGDELTMRSLVSEMPMMIHPEFRQPEVSVKIRTDFISNEPLDVLSHTILDSLSSTLYADALLWLGSAQYRHWRKNRNYE